MNVGWIDRKLRRWIFLGQGSEQRDHAQEGEVGEAAEGWVSGMCIAAGASGWKKLGTPCNRQKRTLLRNVVKRGRWDAALYLFLRSRYEHVTEEAVGRESKYM